MSRGLVAWNNPVILAQIISGFLSFGTLHIKTSNFEPWQWCVDTSTKLDPALTTTLLQAYDHHRNPDSDHFGGLLVRRMHEYLVKDGCAYILQVLVP